MLCCNLPYGSDGAPVSISCSFSTRKPKLWISSAPSSSTTSSSESELDSELCHSTSSPSQSEWRTKFTVPSQPHSSLSLLMTWMSHSALAWSSDSSISYLTGSTIQKTAFGGCTLSSPSLHSTSICSSLLESFTGAGHCQTKLKFFVWVFYTSTEMRWP